MMVSRKDLIMAILATFCLTSTLVMIRPTGSNPGLGEYDPWVDLNDDGTIDIYDAITLANAFETSGTPINKTGLLLELQSKIDSLNASLTELMNQVKNIYEVEIKAYCPIENKNLSVDIAKNGLSTNFTTTHSFLLIGNNTFTVPALGPNNHTFTHWNTGSTDTTITVSSPGDYIAYYEPQFPYWFEGLVGYWKFDEGNGSIALDSSGNNNTGTLVNGPLWVDGKYGKALGFNGINNYVEVQDAQSLHMTTTFTIEAWVRVEGSTDDHQVIMTKGVPQSQGYILEFQPDGMTPQLVIGNPSGIWLASNVTVNFGNWVHIVGTYDGVVASIFVNGTLAGEIETIGSLIPNNELFCIGSHSPANGEDRNFFYGKIDNVMVYNRALNETEILEHYLSRARGLVGYWKFDEGSGTTAFDSSGNGNNGTLENNPTWVDGKYGKALSFDGIDDYVAIPDLCSTSPSELTVSAWINSSLISTWWRAQPIIHQCRNGEFGLELLDSGVIVFGVKVASGVGAWDVRWNPSPSEWHQVVGTWKKGDAIKLYVDGTLVNQTAANDEFLYDANWLDAAIGSLYRSEAFFDGTIDEVMVYNRTLSADEIEALYLLPPP